MSTIDELRKLKPMHVASWLALFLAIIAPGFLTIFLYRPELVSGLDTLKLLVFSASLTLPILLFNVVGAFAVLEARNESVDQEVLITLTILLTCLSQYLALLIAYLVGLSFKGYLLAVFLTNLGVIGRLIRAKKSPDRAQ